MLPYPMHVCKLNSFQETKCTLVLLNKLFLNLVWFLAELRDETEDFVRLFLLANALRLRNVHYNLSLCFTIIFEKENTSSINGLSKL